MPNEGSIGLAIGEQASGIDRAGMLTQIAENKEQFIEEGKKRAAEAQAKQKVAARDKDWKFLTDKLSSSKVDEAMINQRDELAKKTYSEINDIYDNTRTPEEFEKQAGPKLIDFNGEMQKLQQSGANYKEWRDKANNQEWWNSATLDERAIASAVADGDDSRDIGKKIEENQKNGLMLFTSNAYNPKNGFLAKPDPSLGTNGKRELIYNFAKSIDKNSQWAQDLGKKFLVNSTEYQMAINYLPYDDAAKTKAAKDAGITNAEFIKGLPTVKSKAAEFIETPEGQTAMMSWLKDQFKEGELGSDGKPIGAYRTNTGVYFKQNANAGQGQSAFILNKDKVKEDYTKYVEGEMLQAAVSQGKNIVGRPQNSNSYGSVENRQKDFNAKAAIIKAAVAKAKAEQSKVNSNRRALQSEKEAAETAVQALTQQQSTLENSREDFESGKFNGSIDDLPGWKEYAASTGAASTTGTSGKKKSIEVIKANPYQ